MITLEEARNQYIKDTTQIPRNETYEQAALRGQRIARNFSIILSYIVGKDYIDTRIDDITDSLCRNIDGGAANTIYLTSQVIDGGGASSQT